MEKLFIKAADGYHLSAAYYTPVGKSIGTIVISPATGVKKEFYANFSNFLLQRGYTVLLYDYRGIGGSAPLNLKISEAYIHEWGTKDMNAVVDFLVHQKGLSNIIWIGHSIGAQLVGFLEQHQHISKVIAINAALGYWKYFPFPMKFVVWFLWFLIGPLMIKFYGYGTMQKIGWGEDLPRNALLEWREWCLNKYYYKSFLQQKLKADKFYHFTVPITSIYVSDDFIANDITVPLMMNFFPNSPCKIVKLPIENYTSDKVGHTGIFRKKFMGSLWPVLLNVIEEPSVGTRGNKTISTQLATWRA